MSTARTLALGALMLVGVGAVAEAQVSPTPQPRADTGSLRRGTDGRPDRGMRKSRHGKRGGRDFAMARDLNLTEAQRTQIRAIHAKYQPQHRALRDRARPFLDAARTARQTWDSAGFRTNTERARQVMAGNATLRTQEQAEIRAILTAEQRTKFDAHIRQMSERRAKWKSEGGRRGPGRARPTTTRTIS